MTSAGAAKDLTCLFRPASVAIVGCSPIATGKLGSWALRNMLLQHAPIEILPINGKYDEIDGLPCAPSLDALTTVPDLALVLVPAGAVLDELRKAEAIGVKGAIVFGSGFGETEAGTAREAALAEFARRSPMPICGPNTDGIVNIVDGIPCGFPPFAALTPRPVGDVAVVSQSGALVSQLVRRLIRNGAGLTYSCAIGNAVDLGVADYVRHLAHDERTQTILVYAEGMPDGAAFGEAAGLAIDAGKTVAVLKGGRSEAGGVAARSHSGSLVGSHDAFVALCRERGVVVVDHLEHLAALPRLAPVARRLSGANARRVAIVTGSGAIGVTLADEATTHGLEVVPFTAQTTERLAGRLHFADVQNPVDLTAQVVHDEALHADVLAAVADDPSVGLLVSGLLFGPAEITDRLKRDVAAVDAVPVVVYTADASDAADEPLLASVPVLPSADGLFGCLGAMLDARDSRSTRPPTVPVDSTLATATRDNAWAWNLLQQRGIQIADHRRVADAAAAAAAAADLLGVGQVAVKVDSEHIPHKTELGMVELGLATAADVAAAFERVAAATVAHGHEGAPIIVQQMAPAGVEVLLGARYEPGLGPFVVLAAGGLFTEVMGDSVLAPAPLDPSQVHGLLDRMRLGRVLRGARRTTPLALDALADAVARFSQIVAALGPDLGELEINPLIVTEHAAIAVDVAAQAPSPRPEEPA